jgi:hypothetical protein
LEYKKKLRPNKYGQTERDSEKEDVEQGSPEDDVKLQAAKDRFQSARVLRVGPARTVRHRRTEQRLPAPRHSVVNKLSSVLLSSPTVSSFSSVSSSSNTFANSTVWTEDRRERDRRWEFDSWELDRRFVATDRLSSRLVLPLVYGCGILCICICIHLYMYDDLSVYTYIGT